MMIDTGWLALLEPSLITRLHYDTSLMHKQNHTYETCMLPYFFGRYAPNIGQKLLNAEVNNGTTCAKQSDNPDEWCGKFADWLSPYERGTRQYDE